MRVQSDAGAGLEAIRALWDWRRQVAALYVEVRAGADPRQSWQLWRDRRDALFRHHPQSPLDPDARGSFQGLPCFDHDPALRFAVNLVPPAHAVAHALPAGADGTVKIRPFARTHGLDSRLGGELTLYWLDGYGGGVFLPFRDATSGRSTYGGGRYLLDTIKGADPGSDAAGRLILDFNFAYNPSCAYAARWVCPLSPPENTLPAEIEAGEMWSG